MNVNDFNSVTFARVLSYRWVLHYFSTIPVGRIKIVTIYKRSIFQVEWLIATLILCISHCSESDSVSSRVCYSAVSTAPRFLFIIIWNYPLLISIYACAQKCYLFLLQIFKSFSSVFFRSSIVIERMNFGRVGGWIL